MLYELRQHDAQSANRLDALNREFDTVILPAWKRHGIESVGFWSVLVGPTSPRLCALLAWEDLGQRLRLWDAFSDDPEWKRAQAERPEDPAQSVTSAILRPLPGSRLARHDNQPPRLAGGVFELRHLAFDQGAQLIQAAQWFESGGLAHMEKHGMFVMGVWETYLGVTPFRHARVREPGPPRARLGRLPDRPHPGPHVTRRPPAAGPDREQPDSRDGVLPLALALF